MVVRADGRIGSIEERYQVSEDEIMSHPQGQKCLRAFLEDKGVIYKTGASLDPDRFLQTVLPGATPVSGQPEVYALSAVHERFLSAPGLRLSEDELITRADSDAAKVWLKVARPPQLTRRAAAMRAAPAMEGLPLTSCQTHPLSSPPSGTTFCATPRTGLCSS